MATANVEDLANEFDQIVEERDVASVATLGLAGAGGGIIATQIVNRLAPQIGLSPDPSTPRETIGVGTVKMVIGVGLGLAGLQIGGTGGTLAAIAGIGTLVLGGGDFFNALLNMGGMNSSAPQASVTTTSATTTSSQPSATPVEPEDDVQFRASANGGGGSTQARANGNGSFR